MPLKIERNGLNDRRLDHLYEPPILSPSVTLSQDTLKCSADHDRLSLEIRGGVQQSILGLNPSLTPPIVFPSDESLDFEAMKCMEVARDHQAQFFKLAINEIGHQRKANKSRHQDLEAVKDQVEKKQKLTDIATLIKKIASFVATLFGIGAMGASIATGGLSGPLLILPAIAGLFSVSSNAVHDIFQREFEKQSGLMREHKEHISLNQKKIEDLTTSNQLAVQQAHDLWKIAMSLHQSRNIHFF